MTKRLYRSETNKMIAGVCGGLGEVFGFDPTFARLAFVLFSLGCGAGIVAYIACIFIIPLKSNIEVEARTVYDETDK